MNESRLVMDQIVNGNYSGRCVSQRIRVISSEFGTSAISCICYLRNLKLKKQIKRKQIMKYFFG